MAGGPQNLYNLFSQYPADSYAILTGYTAIKRAGIDGNKWLGGDYYFYDHIGEYRSSIVETRPVKSPSEAKSSLGIGERFMAYARMIPGVSWLMYALITWAKILLMTVVGVWAATRSGSTLLLGISDHGPALIATYFVSKLTGKPYGLYFYDIYLGNNFHAVDDALAKYFEPKLFRDANIIILTNEGTDDFYRARYGKTYPSAVVHNSVFAEGYEAQRTPYQPRKPYSILFTGHVYWAQEQSVLNLIKAMAELDDLPIRLDLYMPGSNEAVIKAAKGKKNIRLMKPLPASEMPSIQTQAALLFLPLAWHTNSPEIIATATPGKFTDYLASGRPMLVHAPTYAYVSTYTKRHRLGLVLDRDDPKALAKILREYFAQPGTGSVYIKRALKIFYQNHNAKDNAHKLMNILNHASNSAH